MTLTLLAPIASLTLCLSPTSHGSDPEPLEAACALARNWLAEHQDEDGKWDSDGFMKHDPEDDAGTGAGQPEFDVAVTSLALLAFLGDGQTHRVGPRHEQVRRGLEWLCAQQGEDGLIGEKHGHAYLYGHAIATLALCEANLLGGDDTWKEAAQRAVDYALSARNPYGVWRYDCPPVGDNDSSVTGWMVAAMTSAKEGGLEVGSNVFESAASWYDEVTDTSTGRVGYDSRGSRSSRIPGVNDKFPIDVTETMTAVGLFARFLIGQEPDNAPVMQKHADLLLKALPDWSPDGLTNDVNYWFFGSLAMFQMGGEHWKAWSSALKDVFLEKQIREGAAQGSWDPDGPWGPLGGRVYSTAMGVLALETWYRYGRIVGAR